MNGLSPDKFNNNAFYNAYKLKDSTTQQLC